MYNIKPIKYSIYLDIDFEKLVYEGNVKIEIELLKKDIPIITLNYKELVIDKASIDNVDIKYELKPENEEVFFNILEYRKNNVENKFINLDIKFHNKVNKELDGLYYSEQNGYKMITTQMEPTDARRVFPCIDRPDVKSIFGITVAGPKDKVFLSNMPKKEETMILINNETNKKRVVFEDTPIMSTYLIGIIVGDLSVTKIDEINLIKLEINNEINETKIPIIHGYSIDDLCQNMSYSVRKTIKGIKFFNNWFGIPYSLPKLDIVCVPNFGSGAMENWGLITFKEENISCPKASTGLQKMNINEVIYHELAHQWFGNLVTLNDWSNIWLNESFATIFSWICLFNMEPELFPKQWFYINEMKRCLTLDALDSTHSVLIKINNKNSVNEIFDEISYSKGSCIINYIMNYCGDKNFQDGIKEYINKYQYKNTTSEDLYDILEKTSKRSDLKNLIISLLNQKGYPIIYVRKEVGKIVFTKKTFSLTKKEENFEDYSGFFYLKIKYKNKEKENKYEYIKFDKNMVELDINNKIEDSIIINPDNNYLCIIKYENLEPNLNEMNYTDKIYYIDTLFLLGLGGFIELNYAINKSELIIDNINLEKVNLDEIYSLIHIIILNIEKIYDILGMSKNTIKLDEYKKVIKRKFNKFFEELLKILVKKPTILYTEDFMNEILIFLCNYLENDKIKKLVFKIFDEIYEEEIKKEKINIFLFNESLFEIVIKNNCKEYYNKIESIQKKSINIFINNSARLSKTLCNDQEIINKLLEKMFIDIKNSDISRFIEHMSINKAIDTLNFIKKNEEKLKNYGEKVYNELLKRLSNNIFTNEEIDIFLNLVKNSTVTENKLIYNKIIEMINYNKLVCKNLEKVVF